jgi:parallel beta-helix repeat protein
VSIGKGEVKMKIALAILCALALCVGAAWGTTLYVNPDNYCGGSTPCYPTIQAAVNVANPGDIIVVASGTYNERVVVDKANLMLESASGAATTIIVCQPFPAPYSTWKNGIQIVADGVTVDGFTVRDAIGGFPNSPGILLGDHRTSPPGPYSGIAVSGVSITNCILDNNDYGIYLFGASNNVIENNEVMNCPAGSPPQAGIGVILWDDHNRTPPYTAADNTDNIIRNNNIHDNARTGLYVGAWTVIVPVGGNQIYGNTFSNNGPGGTNDLRFDYCRGLITIDQPTAHWQEAYQVWDAFATVNVPSYNVRCPLGGITIQAAIDAAVAGGTVNVAPGTYIDDKNGDDDDSDPGERGAVADIHKSGLTLRSTHGPEVTIIKSIGKEGGDGAIRIRGDDAGNPTTGVTVDGFTVYNTGVYSGGAGIMIGGLYVNDNMGYPANANTVKNCIIGNPTDQLSSPSHGVILWCSMDNVIQSNIIYKARNEYNAGNGIILLGGMSHPHGSTSPNNQILDNEIHDSDTWGIFFCGWPYQYFNNVIVRGNTITGSRIAGIGLTMVLGSDLIPINCNNIYDNACGGSVWDCDATVNAENNWWGDASGPGGVGPGTGDAVWGDVDFDPWLIAPVVGDVCPRFPMDEFAIDYAKIEFNPKSNTDKAEVKGHFDLDLVGGDGVAIEEDVTFSMNDDFFSQTIKMTLGKKGKWEYKRPAGKTDGIKEMTIEWKGAEFGKFKVIMDQGNFHGITNPVTFKLQIGDDVGKETVTMRQTTRYWEYKGGGAAQVVFEAGAPLAFALSQNNPNPFSRETSISFTLPVAGHTMLDVFDASGRLVETLVDEEMSAGIYTVTWDRENASSGVYFYRLSSNGNSMTRKMVVVR